jgi:hypothetical protein
MMMKSTGEAMAAHARGAGVIIGVFEIRRQGITRDRQGQLEG